MRRRIAGLMLRAMFVVQSVGDGVSSRSRAEPSERRPRSPSSTPRVPRGSAAWSSCADTLEWRPASLDSATSYRWLCAWSVSGVAKSKCSGSDGLGVQRREIPVLPAERHADQTHRPPLRCICPQFASRLAHRGAQIAVVSMIVPPERRPLWPVWPSGAIPREWLYRPEKVAQSSGLPAHRRMIADEDLRDFRQPAQQIVETRTENRAL